jgi:hypothetical protein
MPKNELIDELNDLIDTMSPKDATRIFTKLTMDDLMVLITAIRLLRQNRDAEGNPRD